MLQFRSPILISLFVVTVCACKDARGSERPASTQHSGSAGTDECDRTLWDHVYNPSRLKVINDCVTTSGVISEIDADDDGDEHMLLHLDAGQESLASKKNFKKKGGDLVVEVVCAHPPTLKKAKGACRNYHATIKLPQQGEHVVVTGSFVNDTHNGWTEIHPASSITKR
jgi:hypothetical protein